MRQWLTASFFILISMLACGLFSQSPTATPLPPAETATAVFTETAVATFTTEATFTFTPTITETPSVTPTPTSSAPSVTVNKQAHCRYGPSVAYLHAADLFAGDRGTVRYRALYSNWLYIQFDKLTYSCWVAPSVVDVTGDVSTLEKIEPDLQRVGSNRYGPPQNVQVSRSGDEVTITWERVTMTKDDDRGYFIEAFVCQDGAYIWWTDSYPDQYSTSYTVKDEAGCAAPSWGRLYTVEKHGFSKPVELDWPQP
ncbi:MAG TPA: fibronectin type III domain-containing protein [Anaerolineales bacterium]|nr:fibronectin type III domain-containing protein [Anaerolineales bacterium]HNN14171.1 fibronectin type III domain-containing protein [Anaerolineales bacterium]HNO32257.1 fibronectin type III domain-containing protein [Anaerolineales bacterium]